MFFPTKEQVEAQRKLYPVGCRVQLVRMNDPFQPPPVGTIGEVTGVDDAGSVMVNWSNGSSLSVVFGVDVIRRI